MTIENYNSMRCPKCKSVFFILGEALKHTTCGVQLEYHYATMDPKHPLYKCPACGNIQNRHFHKKGSLLFVDDRSRRIRYAFDEYGLEYKLMIAPSVPEALRQISAQEWSVISLDYDLDGYDFQNSDEETCGMEIIRYIEKMGWPYPNKPIFYIHSSNQFGVQLMRKALIDMGFSVCVRPVEY